MDGSMVSSPNKSSLSERRLEDEDEGKGDEDSPEESTWTEYLDGYSDYMRGLGDPTRSEQGRDFTARNHSYTRSDSMLSDAGSGQEWKIRSKNNNIFDLEGSSLGGGGVPPNMPKSLNFKNKMPYDDSMEDTASSPDNSPKIAMGLKSMDINSMKADEAFDKYKNEEGRTIMEDEGVGMKEKNVMKYRNRGGVEEFKELREMGLCLVPVTMAMNIHYNKPPF